MFVNYRIADGNVIYYGGYDAESEHATLELAEKRLKAYLRHPLYKHTITEAECATAEKSVWWAYKQKKNLELGKPIDAHY